MKEWFNAMGIDHSEGFAKDVFHLMTGIDHSLGPTASFSVSAGNGFRMGITF